MLVVTVGRNTSPLGRAMRVLIAEDNPHVARLLSDETDMEVVAEAV